MNNKKSAAGKGDKFRPVNGETYRKNFDEICWRVVEKPDKVVGQCEKCGDEMLEDKNVYYCSSTFCQNYVNKI